MVLQQTNATQPGTLTGTVIGIEKQKQPSVGKDTVDVELLNLWCADGMRSLQDERGAACALPQSDHGQRVQEGAGNAGAVARHAEEGGEHQLRRRGQARGEGRLRRREPDLEDELSPGAGQGEGDKPYLQGWAVVENPTDEDWKDVRMALVSGRPISFQMDLYQPLYVTRPVVEPELFASLRPVAYSGGLDGSTTSAESAAEQTTPMAARPGHGSAEGARSEEPPPGCGGIGGATAGRRTFATQWRGTQQNSTSD